MENRDAPVLGQIKDNPFCKRKFLVRGNNNAVLWLDKIRRELSSDPDHDGLTTEQEQSLATNPLNRDTDGDGMSEGEELLAGTFPANRESVLKITSVGMDLNRNLTLRWAGATNRLYRVNRSEGLSWENYSTLTNDVRGLQPFNSFIDSGVTNRSFFYWLKVESDISP